MDLSLFVHWYLEPWRKYAVFSGRAPRIEFWTFALTNLVVLSIWNFLMRVWASHLQSGGHSVSHPTADIVIAISILYFACLVFLIVPTIAVTARRLHDIGQPAWFCLLYAVPLVGPSILWVMSAFRGQPESNRYGANPYDTDFTQPA